MNVLDAGRWRRAAAGFLGLDALSAVRIEDQVQRLPGESKPRDSPPRTSPATARSMWPRSGAHRRGRAGPGNQAAATPRVLRLDMLDVIKIGRDLTAQDAPGAAPDGCSQDVHVVQIERPGGQCAPVRGGCPATRRWPWSAGKPRDPGRPGDARSTRGRWRRAAASFWIWTPGEAVRVGSVRRPATRRRP